MRMIRIGEKIIRFRCPSLIRIVQCIEIAGWRGIEGVHIATIDDLSIDILDQFVDILKVMEGILVLKVVAKCHDDVVCFEKVRLRR